MAIRQIEQENSMTRNQNATPHAYEIFIGADMHEVMLVAGLTC